MNTPDDVLKAAVALETREQESLGAHAETIAVLRAKQLTWREIAQFLTEHGVPVDHTRVFRYAKANQQRLQDLAGRRLNMAASNEPIVPSADEYATALRSIEISDGQRKMLGEHFNAHNRTMTYTELAETVGSEHHQAANHIYGTLGRKLGEALDFRFVRTAKGEPFYSSSIGFGSATAIKGEEFRLVMHHELAKAIEKIGWYR